jgi:hypothetical protein
MLAVSVAGVPRAVTEPRQAVEVDVVGGAVGLGQLEAAAIVGGDFQQVVKFGLVPDAQGEGADAVLVPGDVAAAFGLLALTGRAGSGSLGHGSPPGFFRG